ncbi:MAG: toll/interleukin-1 receptor domain-containing protein [Pseudomonadota bacterium]
MALDSTGRLKPIGFWSYARQDDELSDGQLSALRVALSRELQQLYGRQKIQIWQDVAAIAPGAEWERSIDEAIGQSSFMIPIVTPNFIESEWCCKEVEKFLAREAAINAQYPGLEGKRRIFPIGYLPTDGSVPHKPAVVKELEKLQFADFSALRYEDPKSSEFRRAVGAVAGAVCALLKTPAVAPKPASTSAPKPTTSSSESASASKPAEPAKKDFEQWFEDTWKASGYIKPKPKPKRKPATEGTNKGKPRSGATSGSSDVSFNQVYKEIDRNLREATKRKAEWKRAREEHTFSLDHLIKALGMNLESALKHLKLEAWPSKISHNGRATTVAIDGAWTYLSLTNGKVTRISMTVMYGSQAVWDQFPLLSVKEVPFSWGEAQVRKAYGRRVSVVEGEVIQLGGPPKIDQITLGMLEAVLNVYYDKDRKRIERLDVKRFVAS